MARRAASGLLVLALLTPSAVAATTAASLSGRITVDGSLDDFSGDEWVLDPTSAFPERGDDSRWGSDADIHRVAVTWDAERVYLALDCRLVDASVLVLVGGAAGGLQSLDPGGDFRRAIAPPFAANLIALATPGDDVIVAHADAAHGFARVDPATVPAAMISTIAGDATLEMAVPWSMLRARRLRLVVAVTGSIGSGAGDAAPDPRSALSTDRAARALLDRWIEFDADADADGTPDAGVSPRDAGTVETGPETVAERGDAGITATVTPKRFAPDTGETTAFEVTTPSGAFDRVEGRCTILSIAGRAVRSFVLEPASGVQTVSVEWDGRDDGGRVVDGGIYVAAFDLEFTAGGAHERARKNVGVAVVR